MYLISLLFFLFMLNCSSSDDIVRIFQMTQCVYMFFILVFRHLIFVCERMRATVALASASPQWLRKIRHNFVVGFDLIQRPKKLDIYVFIL